MLKESIQDIPSEISFEVISHRFTLKAKKRILDVFHDTALPMNEEERSYNMDSSAMENMFMRNNN